MVNFEFLSPTKIIFGKGVQKNVGEEVRKYGKRVLLHYGGGHIKKTGLYNQVIDSLKKSDVSFIELGGVKPNPRLMLVKEGIELCRRNDIDFILAVGGGSVIDSSKAIAVGVPYDGDVWDFYSEKAVPNNSLPIGVVLTIPAAGSEASNGSVITDWEEKNKRHLDFDSLRPKFSIMNPELTFSLSPYQSACGIADIMTHIMERYFTRVSNVELTDRLCEGTLKTVINNALKILDQRDNYDSRAEIMWAGTIAHNNLLSTGRVGDFASHMIEHELSAINDVAHGAGLAIVFPAWMKYVYKNDIMRFVQYAIKVWNVEIEVYNLEKTAIEGIQKLEAFYKKIGLPTRLSEIGINESHYKRIAENCRRFDGHTVGNFVKLNEEDIVSILKIAQ